MVGISNLSQLAVVYQNLLSGGAQEPFMVQEDKILVMDSAAIGQAGTAQLGTYPLYGNEATETAQEVAANFSTLQSIAAFVVLTALLYRSMPA